MTKVMTKSEQRTRRRRRIRSRISGTADMPRLSVFKSSRFIYAQLIDDENGITLASASSMKTKKKKSDAATEVGKAVASAAKAKGVSKVVFDRGGYIYTGRVKAVAEAAREEGLVF
jgi:large subunit ribosomal protein L18